MADIWVQLSPIRLPAAIVAGGWAPLHLDIRGKGGDPTRLSLEKMVKMWDGEVEGAQGIMEVKDFPILSFRD